MPPLVVAGVMVAVVAAGTAMSVMASKNAAGVQGDTAMMNAQLRSKELISQAQMAENQAQVSERDAILSDQAATGIRQATAFDVARSREQGQAFQAQQRVSVAGAGLEATGSPLLIMSETAKQLELDRTAQTHAGEMQAREAEEEGRMARYGAQMSRYQAEQLRKGVPLTMDIGRYQARAARQGGNIEATRSIISGAGRVASIGGAVYGGF